MEKVCACTGSRPTNFPWNYDGPLFSLYIKKLRDRIIFLIESDGVTTFISGMAMGADIDIAETVLQLKSTLYPNIRLECAVPFHNHGAHFPPSWKARHDRILQKADSITVLGEEYNKQCYHIRNRYMVDNCDILFAVWNGRQTGGTAYTMKYAYKLHKTVDVLSLEHITFPD